MFVFLYLCLSVCICLSFSVCLSSFTLFAYLSACLFALNNR